MARSSSFVAAIHYKIIDFVSQLSLRNEITLVTCFWSWLKITAELKNLTRVQNELGVFLEAM